MGADDHRPIKQPNLFNLIYSDTPLQEALQNFTLAANLSLI